jgi:hypothetical protein
MPDYDTREISLLDGEPVEAFRFVVNGIPFRYTSADHIITINDEDYFPIPLHRERYRRTGSIERSLLQIRVARDLPVLYTSGKNSLTIFRRHTGTEEFRAVWMGRFTGTEWTNAEAAIKCESIISMMQRPGLRAKYQIMCRRVLGDHRCRVDLTTYQTNATVTAKSGLTLTLDFEGTFDAGWFFGGHMAMGPQMRTIIGHTGNQIMIDRPIMGLDVDSEILLWPGCLHTMEYCESVFGNLPNYAGEPWIPQINPFSGLGNAL